MRDSFSALLGGLLAIPVVLIIAVLDRVGQEEAADDLEVWWLSL